MRSCRWTLETFRAANLISCIVLAAALCGGCASTSLEKPRPWHVSPSADPRSSMAYPMVAWDVVQRIRPGMNEAEATAILGWPLESYHHPVNAIVYSRSPDGVDYEVALKLSPDRRIEELSYKRVR